MLIFNFKAKTISNWNITTEGYGYNTEFFNNSGFFNPLKSKDWKGLVYTTDQRFFYYLTNYKAGDFPLKLNPYTKETNHNFEQEWAQFIEKAKHSNATLVWIRNGAKKDLYPSHEDINKVPGVKILFQDYYLTIAFF
jgi:hypothetical protein